LKEPKEMNFTINRAITVVLAGVVVFNAGCSTKKYVRNQTAPLINKTNELDDLTAKTSKEIKDVDARAQQGIQSVNEKAAAADQKAVAAGQSADQAQQVASTASTRVEGLTNTVANLDNYHAVAETSVHFGFDKAVLTKKAKEALDQLANDIPNTKGYVVEIEGGTDSVGSPDYNYKLSERRAQAVIQYLAQNYNIPAHKIYVIGLGEDKSVAPNNSSHGRAQNRRVDVRLLTNVQGEQPTSAQNKPGQQPVANQPQQQSTPTPR
jgi:OmpA-OmpF porin, OOP family